MKLEDQVVSLELAKKLKELGVRRDSAFYWIGHYINTTDCVEKPETARLQLGDYGTEYMWKYPAFAAAELGQMLPNEIEGKYTVISYRGPSGFYFADAVDFLRNSYGSNVGLYIREKTEADARAKMLIHLIEKGLVKP